MLDCEPSENNEWLFKIESGGRSASEPIDVHVLERERFVREGRAKTGTWTSTLVSKPKITRCKRETHYPPLRPLWPLDFASPRDCASL
jgi:hypothetical protein